MAEKNEIFLLPICLLDNRDWGDAGFSYMKAAALNAVFQVKNILLRKKVSSFTFFQSRNTEGQGLGF